MSYLTASRAYHTTSIECIVIKFKIVIIGKRYVLLSRNMASNVEELNSVNRINLALL